MEIIQVGYHPKVIREDLRRLDEVTRGRVQNAIEKKLLVDPIRFGLPLRYTLFKLLKLRVGNFRIVYLLRSRSHIQIVAIGHRSKVYEEIIKRI